MDLVVRLARKALLVSTVRTDQMFAMMGDGVTERNTAKFIDHIICGDEDSALHMLERDDNLDLDLPLDNVERYMTSEIPKVRIDVINSWQFVQPEHVLGCIFIQNTHSVFSAILDSAHRPENISDTDIMICTYLSDIETFRIALTNYPHLMINYRARCTFHTRCKYLECFKPLFMYCFTVVHAALLSCFVYRPTSVHYTRTLSFFKRQKAKVHMLVSNRACLDGSSRYALSLGGQLLYHYEFELFEKCADIGLIELCASEMDILFTQFIRYYKVQAIKYIFQSPYCMHLDFQSQHEYLGHDALIRKGYLRRIDACQRTELTEILVNNNFTFTGNITYIMKLCDSVSRIYNLYHAGVYITDRFNNYALLNAQNQITPKVGLILKTCRSPFTLRRLCCLKVKAMLGPKHYYFKLKQLIGLLPREVIKSLAFVRFTEDMKLPKKWEIPEERVGEKPYWEAFKQMNAEPTSVRNMLC